MTKKAMATTNKTVATATRIPGAIGRSVHIALDAACALAAPYWRGRFCLAGHWSVYHSDCLPNNRRHNMAARAGIAWISTNLLDVQRVRQVQNHLSLSGEGRASFLGVVTTGCSPLPVGGHVQVALAGAPRFILLHQERSEQAHGRLAVGEDADDALAAADLLIEPLLAVGGAQPLAIRGGQRQDRCGVVEAALQRRQDR